MIYRQCAGRDCAAPRFALQRGQFSFLFSKQAQQHGPFFDILRGPEQLAEVIAIKLRYHSRPVHHVRASKDLVMPDTKVIIAQLR